MHDEVFDVLVSLFYLAGVMLALLLAALYLLRAWQRSRMRKLEARFQDARQGYGYQKIWQDAEDRLVARLRHGQRHLVLQDIDLYAEELAAIRAQRFGLVSMDVAAARRDLVAKLMH